MPRPPVAVRINGTIHAPNKRGPKPTAPTKERATFQLPIGLLDRARDAVYFTPGATMAGLMEEALRTHLDKLEKKNGKPFSSRRGAELKTGRPVKK